MTQLMAVRTSALVAAIAGLGLLMSEPISAQTFTVKFGATGGRNDSQQVYQERFRKEIAARTGGRVNVELYPASQLGSMPQMAQGLQLGTIEMVILAPQHLRGIDPRFAVVEAPGLLTDVPHANRAYARPEFRGAYLAIGKEKGLQGVAMYAEGPTVYITQKPIRHLADFKGLKLRVLATELEQKLVSHVGATGVSVEWLEVPSALQRRQIDGLRSGLGIATAFKFFNAAKYVVETGESMIPLGVFMSGPFLQKLPSDLRTAMLEAAKAAEAGMTAPVEEINQRAAAAWKAGGGDLVKLPPTEHEAFMKRAAEIGAQVYKAADPGVREMYLRLQKAAVATK